MFGGLRQVVFPLQAEYGNFFSPIAHNNQGSIVPVSQYVRNTNLKEEARRIYSMHFEFLSRSSHHLNGNGFRYSVTVFDSHKMYTDHDIDFTLREKLNKIIKQQLEGCEILEFKYVHFEGFNQWRITLRLGKINTEIEAASLNQSDQHTI